MYNIVMNKTIQACPKCNNKLVFSRWSNRYPNGYIWQEALAVCPSGCGKFGLRYFDGKPNSLVYQVKKPAEKLARGSYRLLPEHFAAICEVYGSVQRALDNLGQVCMTEQYKP